MKQLLLGLSCAAVIGLGCGGGGGATAQNPSPGGDTSGGQVAAGSLSVINSSNYDIHYLYMSATSESSWGPDQLGSSIIASGSSFTLQNIPCGNYDVKLVDEDRDECEMRNVYLCNNSALNITTDALLQCEGF